MKFFAAMSTPLKKRKLNIIKRHLTPTHHPIKLLDVGCGDCEFLRQLDSKIFDAYGLEPVAEAVSAARQKGLNVNAGNILTCDIQVSLSSKTGRN
jgi:2-polyprenyl-3-methyl-5-hydroxy-6-metoxy-1,4-benzoquinol methylase